MASAAKKSKNFVGVDPEYAVYTNDVDKPLAATAKASEPEAEGGGPEDPDQDPETTGDEKEPEVAGDDAEANKSASAEPKTADAKTTSRHAKK